MVAPRRVLYLTTSLDTQGPASALVQLALRLDRRRYVPYVAQLAARSEGTLARELAAQGIALHGVGRGGPGAVIHLARLMRRLDVQVVHTRLIRADFLGRLAGRLANVPLVVTNLCDIYSRHFEDWHGPAGIWLRRLDQVTLPLAHAVVVNAKGVAADLVAHRVRASDQITTIYNGVDAARFARRVDARRAVRAECGVDANAWVVGTVGRLSRKKRHDVLIDALPQLLRHDPTARLLVVGDGPDRAGLEAKARGLGVAHAVTWAGARANVADWLSAMDVFAFPSEFEGCPNAVLEAMSGELPVVGADVAGTQELVVPGLTGLLVPVGRADALSEALWHFHDSHRRAQAGAAGRARVSLEFTLETMASRFQDFYDARLTSPLSRTA